MSRRKPAKTQGTEWLYLSMAAFNGSGYADKIDADSFLKSYLIYKQVKDDNKAVNLVYSYPHEAMQFAEHLSKANEPGRRPNPANKTYQRFIALYKQA